MNLASFIIFLALIVLFYGNTLSNGFVHDDIWQIEENMAIRELDKVGQVFTTCIAEEILGGCKNIGFYYRPLQYVFYSLVYQISPAPAVFHGANLFLFFVCASLVYLLLQQLSASKKIALFGAVIFITLPVNSEVVNWVSAAPEMLFTIFSLSSLLLYIESRRRKKKLLLLGSCISFLLALLSKETAIFLILLVPVYESVFLKKKKSRVKGFMSAAGLYAIAALFYFAMRLEVLGRVVYKYEGYYGLDIGEQIISALNIIPKYLNKLIYPYRFEFQPDIVPEATFILKTAVVLTGLFLFTGLLFWLYRKGAKTLFFGLVFIFLGIAPVLLFINKLGQFIFSERYLFASSVGVSIVAAGLWGEVVRGLHFKRLLAGIFMVYVAVSFWMVFQRNRDWKDNIVSYQSMIRVDSRNERAYFKLGEIFLAGGDQEQAKQFFEKAVSIDPEFVEAKLKHKLLSQRYNADGFSFYQPAWDLIKTERSLVLVTAEKDFKVEITPEKIETTFEAYLKSRKIQYGTLTQEGLAKIPNTDKAYVRVWSDKVPLLEFFLVKGDKVINITVSPSNSPKMREFDLILGSIKIE